MEFIVVVRASKEQEAIAQLRCLRLTGTNIYMQSDNANAITCLALQLGMYMNVINYHYFYDYNYFVGMHDSEITK